MHFLGILLLIVAALWIVLGGRDIVIRLFNVNRPVELLNVVVGAAALVSAFASRAELQPQP